MILGRHGRGLRLVAAFEAAKGGIVLIVGLGLLRLLHKDAQAAAEHLVHHLRLNPASHYPRIFIDAVAKLDDARLWLLAAFALLYAVFRFVEAYGLWRMRRWAEWVALLSGGIYMPFELFELLQRVTWLRASALLANVLIVVYLGALLFSQKTVQRTEPNTSSS